MFRIFCFELFLFKIGRRKKVFEKFGEQNEIGLNNRTSIRRIFAQHVMNHTSGSIMPNSLKEHIFNYNNIRKRREESKHDCVNNFEKILNHGIVEESITAASHLWKDWNDDIYTKLDRDPLKLYKAINKTRRKLQYLGILSDQIGKHGTNWIEHYFLEFH